MKPLRTGTQRIMLIGLLMGFTTCFAQKPVIQQVDKHVGGSGDVVTFQGSFNNDPTRVSVRFGAARGVVQFVSDQLLEVSIPSGATYENVVVTDLNTGLSAQSAFPFLYSFGGNHGITGATLEGQVDVQSESGLYDLCMCDFDNDGRTDVATANDGSNSISILENTTPLAGLGNISFFRRPFLIGARSIHTNCGDLNGDGKADVVISEGGASGERLFILRNTSTGPGVFTFSVQIVTLTGKKVKRTEISDLDNDGKPELIVTNQTGSNVTILVNQSTPAAITFAATRITLNISGAASTDGLAVADLDGDKLPEIVTSQFLTPTSNLFIFKNRSIPGNVSFNDAQTIAHTGPVVNLKVGDLDGDDKPEIATTQLLTSSVSIFRNVSTTSPSFAAPVDFLTDGHPWGLDFGDIDGDGLTDIVVASLTDAEKTITMLNNESVPGGLDFSTIVHPTTYINRHVGVGDVDGDAKPDIIFTSIDDNNTNILPSSVSVLRNKSCLVPVIDPAGPITICSGFPLQLTTRASNGANYEWIDSDGSGTVKNGPDAFFDVTTSGSYSVLVTAEGGACSETSAEVSVTVDPGSTSGPANAGNDGPVCRGSTVSLYADDVGATAYNWTGPAGYTGTGTTPAPITNFQLANAGRYFLDVIVNGCVAEQTSTVVEMISSPDFQVTYAGADVICPPDTKTLTVVPYDTDFTYQWAERTSGDIGGATGETVSVNGSGEYFVKATYIANPACLTIESTPAVITFTTPPVADFSAPVTACTSQVIDFTNQSTGDANLTRFYEWDFGNSNTSTQENPTYQYTTANTYTVTLKVTYENGACENQTSKSITIQAAPTVSITTPLNEFSLCTGDTLELGVNGTFSSYQWSTGAATPTIEITLPGNYSVDVTDGTCILTAAVTVDELGSPAVIAVADPAQLNEGQTSQLTATGLETYTWDPAETLSDPAIANPIASPTATTVYTVQGTDANGCTGMATVEVSVKGDLIVNKLGPARFFSPDNGDAINPYWRVENITDYPQCSVAIYDDKGIKVYDAKPYNNDWDGTYNGKQLPDGVYYYIIRCDGEENTPRAGSITILR